MHCLCVHCWILPFNRAVVYYPLYGGTHLSNQDTPPHLSGKLSHPAHSTPVYTRRNQGFGSPIPHTKGLKNALRTDRESVSLNTLPSSCLHIQIARFSTILSLFKYGSGSALTGPSWLFQNSLQWNKRTEIPQAGLNALQRRKTLFHR